MPPNKKTQTVQCLNGVRLPHQPTDSLWDISFNKAGVSSSNWSISPHSSQASEERSMRDKAPLVLPALVHPHIHLDKAFIHSSPEYADLVPIEGTFSEALSFTARAKERFTLPDLLRRGNWLIAESVAAGVTAMRAFVEVDSTVQMKCLEAGSRLKRDWKDICHIQIVAFAQDPIFSGPNSESNRRLMETAVRHPDVDVIGTTPYVETDQVSAETNISWAIQNALELNKHLDFHLDYHLDGNKSPLVWYVLEVLRNKGWSASKSPRKVMLGHCTRLTLFSSDEWRLLSKVIREHNLPISFVGLPTSDLYMAAAPPEQGAKITTRHNQPRGTLPVIDMIRNYGLNAVIGVNNVDNGFTPWGSADPLFLACLGVGVYQRGSRKDAELLYECISYRARAAIGLPTSAAGLDLINTTAQDLLIVSNSDETEPGFSRDRKTIADVVCNPPANSLRENISGQKLVVKHTTVSLNIVIDPNEESAP